MVEDTSFDGIASAGSTTKVFYIVNPSETSWSSLIPLLLSTIPSIDGTIPYTEWLTALRASVSQLQYPNESILSRGAVLLPFITTLGRENLGEALAKVDMTRARRASPTLREMGPVDGDLLGNWVRQ